MIPAAGTVTHQDILTLKSLAQVKNVLEVVLLLQLFTYSISLTNKTKEKLHIHENYDYNFEAIK